MAHSNSTTTTFLILLLAFIQLHSQPDRWQQRVNYNMTIDFDANAHQFKGDQRLTYYNNSPDTLSRLFYHLYFNAFQPGSMMDVRSRTISDPDRRVGDRISHLGDDEIGYHVVDELKQDGRDVSFEMVGTILEVDLNDPLLPGESTEMRMKFNSQVPKQIRRSGRNNREGIDYSMAQWYPKLCEYDYQGWHANPYVGREFYGVWGDFEVEINIDAEYVLAGSGVLQNSGEIGRGYAPGDGKTSGIVKWHFVAENVHDFVWAADRDYQVDTRVMHDGTRCYFVYQPGDRTSENWANLPRIMDEALEFMNKRYGKYPYPVYYFIQAGDGGMEYPMATLITGERSISSLVGVSVHEWMHSWYQMILGTNESLYAWMDEGFTSYASSQVMNHLRKNGLIPGEANDNPNANAIRGYVNFTKTGLEEPLSIHSDHFMTNSAYGRGSYTKGAVFLKQLEYVMGEENLQKGLLRYFDTWKFKHPNSNDFIRIMEKTSGLELDWYREYFANTTHTIDYSIESLTENGGGTEVHLSKIGRMPMPIDLVVTLKDDRQWVINIPLRIMRGAKPNEFENSVYMLADDWPWTHPFYSVQLDIPLEQIRTVEIDPSFRMADVDRSNNTYSSSSASR